jgi:phosphoglycolate phosphatase
VRPAPWLFDLDGTLAETLFDITGSVNHVRGRYGLPALPADAVRAFVGDGARTLLRRALTVATEPDGAQLDEALLDEAFAAYCGHHETQCTATVRAYPGVRRFLERLRRDGHPCAVVTNKPERFARRIVAHLGLADLLPVVIGGDTLPQRKPDPAPLRAALRASGEELDRGTMVGDGENDLRAGRALGIETIACLFGYRSEAALRAVGADSYWHRFGG